MFRKVFLTALSLGRGVPPVWAERILNSCFSFGEPSREVQFEHLRIDEDPTVLEQKIENLSSVDCPTDERKVIAWIGELLIEAAARCIPECIFEIAKDWDSSNLQQRSEILSNLVMEICEFFENAVDSDSVNSDSQLIENIRPVLPFLYGPPPWDKDRLPNCVGMAIFLAGIVRHVLGVRAYGLIPAATFETSFAAARARVASQFKEVAASDPFNNHEKMMEHIRIYEKLFTDAWMETEEGHLALVVEIGENEWRVGDVNFTIAGAKVPESWRLPEVDLLLKDHSASYPGLAVGVEWDFIGCYADTRLKEIDRTIHAAKELIARFAALEDKSSESLSNSFAGSEAETELARSFYVTEQLAGVNDPVERARVVSNVYWDDSDIGPMIDSDISHQLRLAPEILLLDAEISLSELQEVFGSRKCDQMSYFETAEIVDLDMAVGVLVCSHLSIYLGLTEEVQELLSRHTNVQTQMFYAATATYRQGKPLDDVSRRALQTLSSIPINHCIPGSGIAMLIQELYDE